MGRQRGFYCGGLARGLSLGSSRCKRSILTSYVDWRSPRNLQVNDDPSTKPHRIYVQPIRGGSSKASRKLSPKTIVASIHCDDPEDDQLIRDGLIASYKANGKTVVVQSVGAPMNPQDTNSKSSDSKSSASKSSASKSSASKSSASKSSASKSSASGHKR